MTREEELGIEAWKCYIAGGVGMSMRPFGKLTDFEKSGWHAVGAWVKQIEDREHRKAGEAMAGALSKTRLFGGV